MNGVRHTVEETVYEEPEDVLFTDLTEQPQALALVDEGVVEAALVADLADVREVGAAGRANAGTEGLTCKARQGTT